MDASEVLQELEDALDAYRFEDARKVLGSIDPAAFDARQTKRLLGMVRRKRLFPELERTASLFLIAGHSEPGVRLQWAQALIEQKSIGQALSALNAMLGEDLSPRDRSEVVGLTGRAHKQLYVDDGDPGELSAAIAAYSRGWQAHEGDYRWLGINFVALAGVATHAGLDVRFADDPAEVATLIRDEITDIDNKYVWDYGTAMEASVALDDGDGAVKWLKKYATHPEADAFELGSTTRQLKEVWQLEGTEIGAKLLPVLDFELSRREGAEMQLTDEDADVAVFEAVYGDQGVVNMEELDTIQERAMAVARVFNKHTKRPCGTGFLMRGKAECAAWGDEVVFVTNAHVVSDDPADGAPLRAEDASAEFTRLPGRPKVELGELIASSNKKELDVTVLRIVPPAGTAPLQPSSHRPLVPDDDSDPQRIYVIGHPGGRALAISLYDNYLVGYQDPYVHYRSPTEAGNSGSPVFTRDWRLFALHHAARRSLQANEGVLFELIIAGTCA